MKDITPTIRDLVTDLMNENYSRTEICAYVGYSNGHLYRMEDTNNAKISVRRDLQNMLKEIREAKKNNRPLPFKILSEG